MFSKTASLLLAVLTSLACTSQVVTSDGSLPEALRSGIYKVTVSQSGKSYNSFTYSSKGGGRFGQQGKTFNYSIFSFSQPVTIKVTKLNSSAKGAIIRPTRLGLGTVTATSDGQGKSVVFSLRAPAKISVEFDDDPGLKDAMVLFADSLEDNAVQAKPSDPSVFTVTGDSIGLLPTEKQIVYFPAGIHTIGYWQVPSSIKQVYLANGSFVRGYLYANRKTAGPIMINGRGVISNDIYPIHYPDTDSTNNHSAGWYKTIQIEGGSQHVVEGVTLTDGSSFNLIFSAKNCSISNVNIHGFQLNNDGITTGGNNNVISNCFLHVNDDAFVLYGNDITIKNCTIWQLAGGSVVQLGWSPNSIHGANLIDNIDIIHAEWTNHLSQNAGFINAMTANPGFTNASVENFTVSNIYFDTDIIRFLDIRMMKNGKGQPANFKNFTFDNIHIKTSNTDNHPIIFLGSYDATHKIDGFAFSKIYINGIPAGQDAMARPRFMSRDNLSKAVLQPN